MLKGIVLLIVGLLMMFFSLVYLVWIIDHWSVYKYINFLDYCIGGLRIILSWLWILGFFIIKIGTDIMK